MNVEQTAPEVEIKMVSKLVRRHLQWGWMGLLIFGGVGLAIEGLHGFKLDLYLNVENETRRLMWTLGHAHGTLMSLTQLAFAATLHAVGPINHRKLSRASTAISIAQILIPAGFLAGGVIVHGGDPNLAVLLVPIGALSFLYCCGVTVGIVRSTN